jgi:hypothetical protein
MRETQKNFFPNHYRYNIKMDVGSSQNGLSAAEKKAENALNDLQGQNAHNVNDVEYPQPPQPKTCCGMVLTRKRRLCLMIFCGVSLLLLAIIIPVGIFVIAPKIAQGSIDGSELQLSYAVRFLFLL